MFLNNPWVKVEKTHLITVFVKHEKPDTTAHMPYCTVMQGSQTSLVRKTKIMATFSRRIILRQDSRMVVIFQVMIFVCYMSISLCKISLSYIQTSCVHLTIVQYECLSKRSNSLFSCDFSLIPVPVFPHSLAWFLLFPLGLCPANRPLYQYQP